MSDTEVLAELSGVFSAERDYRITAHPPREIPSECRYCGKYRILYPDTALDGHALCMVSQSFAEHLARTVDDARLTFRQVSEAIGMSVQVVRRWYRVGKGWPAK